MKINRCRSNGMSAHNANIALPVLRGLVIALYATLFFGCTAPVWAQGRYEVSKNIDSKLFSAQQIAPLPADQPMLLGITLPVHNQAALDAKVADLYNPKSPNYRHWLTVDEYTAQFGPTPTDVANVTAFAQKYGLSVTKVFKNRMVMDVTGPVSAVSQAFNVKMLTYRHPTEGRTFYGPDSMPTAENGVPILAVDGLDNFHLPQHRATTASPGEWEHTWYAPGVNLDGTGQGIALIEFGGSIDPDLILDGVDTYGGSPVNYSYVLLDGQSAAPPGSGWGAGEEALDLYASYVIAPGASIVTYNGSILADMVDAIVTDNTCKTMSNCLGISYDPSQELEELVAQGVASFDASGDGGYGAFFYGWDDNPWWTSVGGVIPYPYTPTGGAYTGEGGWNGSTGGISPVWPIPSYQQGINMTACGGSTTMRNIPDVAAVSDDGTSEAAPTWAGFVTLANEQAANAGLPPVGFINPTIYAIYNNLTGPRYKIDFHDATIGGTSTGYGSANCVPGYDLVTGLGSPNGQALINDLSGTDQTSSGNVEAMVTDGTTFGGGIDGDGNAYSATLLGSSLAWNGSLFDFEPANTVNGFSDEAVYLPPGRYATLSLLGTGVNGPQPAQTFTVNYIDGTSASFTQSMSDWATPQNYSGESIAATMPYRDASGGAEQNYPFYLYGYSFPLNSSKTVSSLVFPANQNVVVLSTSLSGVPTTSGLTSGNIADAMVTNGTTFSATGGIDKSGNAYSATLLGSSLTWNGLLFNFLPANTSNAASNKTVTLPAGQYSTLGLLGTGVNGSQASQKFTVKYTDGTSASFTQSMSDWSAPSSFPGESIAATGPYEDASGGTEQNYPFYLYGYSFPINSAKTVSSLVLPANADSVIASIALAGFPTTNGLTSGNVADAIVTDGSTYTTNGGLDGTGYAMSANLLGPTLNWNNMWFTFLPPNTNNAASNETVTLPSGKFSTLALLGTTLYGPNMSQEFSVNYTNGTSTTFTQNMSDWGQPEGFSGESVVATMPYQNTSGGIESNTEQAYLYGYSFPLNNTLTVKSLLLPANANVFITAIDLTSGDATGGLTSGNIEAAVTNGTTFSATGGINGSGNAYSSTLLGSSLTWDGMVFHFLAPNTNNGVSNWTITLPAGQYSTLALLGTAVKANQTSQKFIVNYTNGTSSTFTQSMSDWTTPQSYSGESTASTMADENNYNGKEVATTVHLYGYSFAIKNTLTVSSLVLPANADVVVTAVDLR